MVSLQFLKPISKRQIGDRAEEFAVRFLRKNKHQVIARNFTCRFGEIDLITRDPDGSIVFVEVRFRMNSGFASATESVTVSKQDKLRKTAQWYLSQNRHLQNNPCRFDVIAIQQKEKCKQVSVNWVENAFY